METSHEEQWFSHETEEYDEEGEESEDEVEKEFPDEAKDAKLILSNVVSG